jgi:coatomer protein complex subunit epsilon
LTLPNPASPDYTPTLLYKVRSKIALNNPKDALALIPSQSEDVALKAAAALARYVGSTDSSAAEAALEEMRDLSAEIEGDDSEATERQKGLVRVLAGTAFARAKEIEEALETLGAGSDSSRNLEAYVLFLILFYWNMLDSVI